jgi:hypothetical protein
MTGLFDRDEALGSGPEMPAILAAAHMIRLANERRTVPYVWVRPDDER